MPSEIGRICGDAQLKDDKANKGMCILVDTRISG